MSQPFPLDPFFSGNYAPISFEADAFDLPLRGDLPKQLAGTLYRNGPNHGPTPGTVINLRTCTS
jgi:carotenoid cleavage dioxygenase-like enzyme